jgi:hypothetical protein
MIDRIVIENSKPLGTEAVTEHDPRIGVSPALRQNDGQGNGGIHREQFVGRIELCPILIFHLLLSPFHSPVCFFYCLTSLDLPGQNLFSSPRARNPGCLGCTEWLS